jgi:hypothetical protein
LQIEQIQLATLIPYINNSRTHSDEQVAQIAASIKEFGFNNPILVDKDSGIIAGHGRLQAARKLGLTEVPCVRLEHLTETQRKAYIIADNRLALNAGWDNELLTIELNELLADGFALEILGFDSDELKTLLDPLEPTEGLVDEDQVPEVPEEPKTKPGDIYQLGRHRLMCGDSTSIDAVEKLMDGQYSRHCYYRPALHEPCLYGWMNNGSHSWYSDRKQTSVWRFDKDKGCWSYNTKTSCACGKGNHKFKQGR